MKQPSCLTVLAGLPYSGKSGLIDYLIRQGGPSSVVCPDDLRVALHGQRYAPTSEPFVWAIAEVMARALLLRTGTNVYIDATNTTPTRRAQWINLARELEVECDLYVVRTPLEKILERSRDDSEIGPVIERMAEQWEEPDDELWHLVSEESGGLFGTPYDIYTLR